MRVSNEAGSIAEDFSPKEVTDIAASCVKGIEESKEVNEPEVEETPAWLSVYSPVYDPKATSWRFRLGKDKVYVDITETSISQDALDRGGALSEDAYQVILEVTTAFDAQNKPKEPSYKIKKVIRFVPAPNTRQASLFDPE